MTFTLPAHDLRRSYAQTQRERCRHGVLAGNTTDAVSTEVAPINHAVYYPGQAHPAHTGVSVSGVQPVRSDPNGNHQGRLEGVRTGHDGRYVGSCRLGDLGRHLRHDLVVHLQQ